MSLQLILDYQKIDLGLYQKEKELLKSEEIKIVVFCKKRFGDCTEELKQLKQLLASHYKSLQQITERLTEIEETKKEIESITEFSEEEDLTDYALRIDEYENALQELNKNYMKIVKDIEDVAAKNKELNENMDRLQRQCDRAIQTMNEKKASYYQETKEISAQLKELQKRIEPEFFSKYKYLRDNKKMPAFVCYRVPNCGACGVDIRLEVEKKLLKSGDFTECPHCGRIVYLL